VRARTAVALVLSLTVLVSGATSLLAPRHLLLGSPSTAEPASPGIASIGPGPGNPHSLAHSLLFGLTNRTLPAATPAAGGPPTSAYIETPPPDLPGTTPTVIQFPQSITTCCIYQLFAAPVGTWGAIVFNYTGTAVGGVYDSSYRAYVDGAQILEGTTPEYGTWTVSKDLTEYSSLFHGTVNLTFLLSAALLGGHFVTNLSLSFYPVAPGAAPPIAPSAVVPLWEWNHTYLHAANAVLWANASVPTNVTNATLQLFVYGFGPTDEFWYSAQPGYRQAFVTVDGKLLATVLPFPYINTGGIDLFLWRPLLGDFTLDDRPYEVDVSGSIGMLEGSHLFGGNVSGSLNGNTWLIGGSLLLYTSPRAGAAQLTEYQYSAPPAATSSGTTFSNSASLTRLSTASTYSLSGGTENVTTVLSATSNNNQKLGGSTVGSRSTSTQNISMGETLSTTRWVNDSLGEAVTTRTLEFPFSADLGNVFLVVSSTGTTETVNFTTTVAAFHQEWRETDSTGVGASAATDGVAVRLDDLTTAAGTYSGQEQVNTQSGGATLLGLSGADSATSKLFTYSVLGSSPAYSYSHLLTAGASNPPPPNSVQKLLSNVVLNPLVAAAAVAPGTIDLGEAVAFSARVAGGSGGYVYDWLGLPTGCHPVDAPTVVCTPTSAGTVLPVVSVSDSSGNTTTVGAGVLTVHAALTAAALPERIAWDEGQSLNVTAAVSGGDVSTLSCAWAINDSVPSSPQSCAVPYSLSGNGVGGRTVTVTASDGTGAAMVSPELDLTVNPWPTVTVEETTNNSSALHKAGGAQFNATVVGGTPPYSYAWSVNGTNVSGVTGPLFVLSPTTPETIGIIVWITDAANATVATDELSVDVGAVEKAPTQTAGGGGSTVDYTGWYVALAVAAAAGVLFLLVLLMPKRPPGARRPPPRRPAPRRAPPAS
jgi:hypothetical protein